MTNRKSRKRRSKLMGSHQRCWLWGRHLVLETLRAGCWRPLEVRIGERLPATSRTEIETLASAQAIPLQTDPTERLTQLCGSPEHQGLVARMPPFPYADPDELLRRSPAAPLWAVLGSVQDPHNFGAIVRSAEVLGVGAVLIGEEGQTEVTATVARTSAGAVNSVPIGRSADLPSLLDRLHSAGWAIVGTDAEAALPVWSQDFTGPTAIIIGNESTGLTPALRDCCQTFVSIPRYGAIGSLNAAVAAGILFFEAQRQRTRP